MRDQDISKLNIEISSLKKGLVESEKLLQQAEESAWQVGNIYNHLLWYCLNYYSVVSLCIVTQVLLSVIVIHFDISTIIEYSLCIL